MKPTFFFVLAASLFGCQPKTDLPPETKPLTEFSNYYSDITSAEVYSEHVQDSFRIFKSIPKDYSNESPRQYPLIIILDANAFIEMTVAELKFNSFIGVIPESIVIGIGYKNFAMMDSLRTRDYTYPVAIPEYEMTLSGGADKFKNFVDQELLLKLNHEFKIDMNRTVICGHSLGGYFTLFYALRSIEEDKPIIKNIISASPSLHYNNKYLFGMAMGLKRAANERPINIYISMGSEDMADDESKGILTSFETQIKDKNYPAIKLKTEEFTNFGHIDAAVPGFIKGLTYILGSN